MKKFIVLLFLPIAALAQKNYPALLDEYAQAAYKIKEFNGNVLVMQKGKEIYKKSFGLADREWNAPNTSITKFRIGSITKQFTAAAILQLASQGKLSLDDLLNKYLPGYPKGDSVTIHMLLNHTSGIVNYTNLPEFWPKATLPLSTDSMIAIFKDKPFDFSPGAKWSYSNSGYFLLGVIVEKASGKKFGAYLMDNILKKAGMQNSGMDQLDSILAFRAKGYFKNNQGLWQHAMYISMDAPYSAGAMFSTVDDLYKWIKLLSANQVLPETYTKKMLTAYKNNYGYGIGVDSLKNHPRISHGGGIPGFVTHLAYFPQDDVCVVVLSNNSTDAGSLGNALASLIFDLPVQKLYIPKEVKIDSLLLDKLVGKYMATTPIELIKKDNKLYRHREGTEDIELKPESNTRFFYADDSDRFIEFELDKDGKFINAWLIREGEKTVLKKL